MLRRVILLLLLTLSLNATTATKQNVTKLYVATFNRAPDSAGLDYWVNNSGLNLENIAQSFFDQPEAKQKYPDSSTNSTFIDAIYSNLFNRASDTAGFNYWKAELDAGTIAKSVFILAVVNGAKDSDSDILTNKTDVGLSFADSGRNDETTAKDIMAGVTNDTSTVTSAISSYTLNLSVDSKLYLSNQNTDILEGVNGVYLYLKNDYNTDVDFKIITRDNDVLYGRFKNSTYDSFIMFPDDLDGGALVFTIKNNKVKYIYEVNSDTTNSIIDVYEDYYDVYTHNSILHTVTYEERKYITASNVKKVLPLWVAVIGVGAVIETIDFMLDEANKIATGGETIIDKLKQVNSDITDLPSTIKDYFAEKHTEMLTKVKSFQGGLAGSMENVFDNASEVIGYADYYFNNTSSQAQYINRTDSTPNDSIDSTSNNPIDTVLNDPTNTDTSSTTDNSTSYDIDYSIPCKEFDSDGYGTQGCYNSSDEKEGIWIYKTSSLEKLITYVNGIENGFKSLTFTSSTSKGNMLNGKQHGVWEYTDLIKGTTRTTTYDNGITISYTN